MLILGNYVTILQKSVSKTMISDNEESSLNRNHKTISVSNNTYRKLLEFKEGLSGQLGDYVSFNRAIHHLLRLSNQLKEITAQLKFSEEKNAEMIGDEKIFLRQVILCKNQQPIPVMMGTMANFNVNSPQFTPPPAPPIPQLKPKFRTPYIPLDTGDLKKDYVHEIKQIFTGEMLKPSEIIETTKPKHSQSKVVEFTETFEIPSINSISCAKNFSTHQDVSVEI